MQSCETLQLSKRKQMITRVKRAGDIFKIREFNYANHYYACYRDGRVYAWLHLQLELHCQPEAAYVHLYVIRWGAEVMREMREDFSLLCGWLKQLGIRLILGTHGIDGCEKWERFTGLLGFSPPVQMTTPEGIVCKLACMEV